MRTANIIRAACVAGVAALCMCGVAACSSDSSTQGYTGGVAATVNGVEIAEDDVTRSIQTTRENYGLSDQDTWGEYLAQYGSSPEEIRSSVIDSLVQQELIKQGAEERGISVETSEVDTLVDSVKSNYDDDEKWQNALVQAGYENEEDYRTRVVQPGLLSQKLLESFDEGEPTDEEVVEYASSQISSYDGAKRSSHILFASSDQETAQSVLDQINGGSLDFAEAAKQYSTDSSASDGGDVGWDKLTTFVDAYQTALDELEVNQVSGLVTSDYGIHIIKCTEVFTAPEELTSLDQLPTEFVETFRTSTEDEKTNEAYQAWFDEYETNADIVINDMPEGLPYAVDMSQYETEDTSTDSSSDSSTDASTDSSTDTSTDGTTDGSADASADASTDTTADGSADASSDTSTDTAADGSDASSGDTASSEGTGQQADAA